MKLEFIHLLTPTSPAKLTKVQREQLRIAARQWDGEEHKDLAALLANEDAAPELHRVDRENAPLFDAWIFATDDASLFLHGTSKLAPYGFIQGDVERDEDSKAEPDEELAEALQEAYDARDGDEDDDE
jgi:hypothetical protein